MAENIPILSRMKLKRMRENNPIKKYEWWAIIDNDKAIRQADSKIDSLQIPLYEK